MDTVVIQEMSKAFKTKNALADIDLRLHQGTTYGLIGNNGVGKTTLIRCILGLLRPTSGLITVFQENAYRMSNRVKKKIGVVFDTPLCRHLPHCCRSVF